MKHSVQSLNERIIRTAADWSSAGLPLADMLSDGPDNLRTAFAMAASGKPGIFLAFDRKVMLGCRAVKVRASGFSAFESVLFRSAGFESQFCP